MGNAKADQTASRHFKGVNRQEDWLIGNIRAHNKEEQQALTATLYYLVEMNTHRKRETKEQYKTSQEDQVKTDKQAPLGWQRNTQDTAETSDQTTLPTTTRAIHRTGSHARHNTGSVCLGVEPNTQVAGNRNSK